MAGIPTSGPRLQAWLANPGLRAKLPTSLLTPLQQRQRAMNAQANAPVMPGSTLTTRGLNQEVQAAQTEKYGPALSQAQQNLGSAQQFQGRVGNWFDQYKADLARAQDQIRQSGQNATDEQQALINAASGLNQADAQQNPASSQQTATQAQQAANIRQMLTGSFGAMLANLAKNANDRAALQTNVVAPTAKFNAQLGSQAGVTKAGQALQDLKAQMGAFATQYRGQRLTEEQKNALAAQALGVNEQKVNLAAQALNVNARDKTQKRIIARQKARAQQNSPSAQKTEQEVQFFNKHGYYPGTGAPRGTKGSGKAPRTGLGSLTQSQENGFYKQIDTATTIVHEYAGKLTPQQIRAATSQGYLMAPQKQANGGTKMVRIPFPRLDPAAVSAALDLAGPGHALSAGTVKALHNRGVHVGGRYTVAKPPKPLPAPVVNIGPATAAPPLGTTPPGQ